MISRGSLSFRRSAFFILPACAGLAWLGGCTDSTADDRAQVQDQLADVQIRLASASAGTIRPGAEGYDAAVQELEGVVSSIRGISGGSRGQQGAKELLAATALQDLASMEQQAIDVIFEDIARLRTEVAANAKAALMLNGLADARGSVDVSDERARLDDAGANVQRELTAANQHASELGAPISEREQQNEADRAQVAALRDRAEELYRQSDIKGPAEGLDDYLEGQRLNREADQLERQISERMIDLDYDYAAEHARVNRRVESLRSQLEAVGTTRADLDELMQAFNADASASRAKSGEMAGRARDALNEIESTMTSDVLPLYESAVQHLTDAASQAQSAAGKLNRDAASAARMARVRVLAALGQVHTLHADALDQQASVMELLSMHPDMQGVASRLGDVTAKRDQARQSAVQAYNDAKAAIGGGSNAETLSLQNNLDAVIAKLTGGEIPAPMSTTPQRGGGAPTPGAVTPPTTSGNGFESAQAIVDAITSAAAGDVAANRQLAGGIIASTPEGQATVTLMQVGVDLHEAVVNQFGADAASSMDQNVSFQGAQLVNETATAATVRLSIQGTPAPVDASAVMQNGRWYLSVDEMAAATPGMAMMVPMVQAIAAAMSDVTQRVNDGAFASANEVMMAIQQAIMQSMQPPGGSP